VCHGTAGSAPDADAHPNRPAPRTCFGSLAAAAAVLAFTLNGCGGGSAGSAGVSAGAPSTAPGAAPAQLVLASGFTASVIANVPGARELAALPNGDLLVATAGSTIAIVPAAEAAGSAHAPQTFATIADDHASGIALGPDGNVYVGSQNAVWRIVYTGGASSGGAISRLASVRTGPVAPNSDGDVHLTTSVAVAGSTLFASVGSSCNACTEVDPTRASIQQMPLDGSGMTVKARNYRNAIALAVDPATGVLWAGGAGQDTLPAGHPLEKFDAVTAHAGVVNYGWPNCEDDLVPVAGAAAGACAGVTLPALVFPAYSTLIGATFYPAAASGAYAFPAAYRGGLFITMHGSWHVTTGDTAAAQPQVAFVPMHADTPATAVNWSEPAAQWQPFLSNFGTTTSNRIGRPTGIAVGSQGSLFVADDAFGNIYRIRPASTGAQTVKNHA
jgi:glucose/arabinose dehydrogenase